MSHLKNLMHTLNFREWGFLLQLSLIFFHFFRKKALVLLPLLLWGSTTVAQNIDSLITLGQYWPAYEPVLKACERERTRGGQPYARALVQRLKIEYNLTRLNEALATSDELLRLTVAPDSLYFDALQFRSGVLRSLTRFKEAEQTLLNCLAQQQKFLPANPNDIGQTWHWLGNLYAELARYPEALTALEKAEEMYLKDQDKLWAVMDKTNVLASLARYEEAETLLKTWISSCEKTPKVFGIAYPKALDELADIYNNMGEAEKSVALSIEAEKLCREDLGLQHYVQYGNILLNLASRLFWTYTKIEEADSIYNITAEVYSNCFGEAHVNLQWVRLSRAYYWQYRSFKQSGLDTIRSAVNEIKAIYGDQHPSYALALSNVSFYYDEIQYSKNELPLKQQIVSILERTYGDQHPKYAGDLSSLGAQLYYMGEFKLADSCLQKALKVQIDVFGKEHLDVAQTLNFIAKIREAEGNKPIADSLRQIALPIEQKKRVKKDYSLAVLLEAFHLTESGQIRKADSLIYDKLADLEQQYTRKSPKYASFLHTLAIMRSIQSKYEASDSVYREYLKIVATYADTNSLHYINVKGQVSSRNGKVLGEPAGNWFENLIKSIANSIGTNNGLYAGALKDAADYYVSIDQFEKGIQLYRQSLAILEMTDGSKSTSYLVAKHNLAVWLENIGQYKEAEKLLLETIETHQEMGILAGAETWNSLGTMKDTQGQFKEAEQYYRKAIDYYDKALGNPNHPDLVTKIINRAYLKKGLSQFSQADSLLKRANSIQQKYPEDVPGQIQVLKLDDALQGDLGNFIKSDSLSKAAVILSNHYYGAGHSATSTPYNNAAIAAFYMGRFAEADSLLGIAKSIEERTTGKHTLNYATQLANQGDFRRTKGRFDEATVLLDSALAIRKRIFSNLHPIVATSYISLTNVYFAKGEYEKVVEYSKRALEIDEHFFGKGNYQTAFDISQIAEAFVEMGRYGEADSLQQVVAAILKNVLGEETTNFAIQLSNVANLAKVTGRYYDAIKLYNQSLQVLDRVFKKQNHKHAGIFAALGDVYLIVGNYARADSMRMLAHELYRKFYGEQHHLTGYNLIRLAQVRQSQGKYTQADSLYQVGLGILRGVYGNEHPEITESIGYQSELYRLTGRHDEALTMAHTAKNMRSKTNGETETKNIFLNLQLAKTYTDLGEYSRADSLMEVGIAQLRSVNPEHPRIADFLLEQAILYKNLSLYGRADSTLADCFRLLKMNFPDGHPLTAKSLALQAEVHLIQGKSLARKKVEEALALDQKLLPPNHPDYLDHRLLLARCYRKAPGAPDFERARSIYAELKTLFDNSPDHNFLTYSELLSEMTSLEMQQHQYYKGLNLIKDHQKRIAKALGEDHPRMTELYFEEAWANAEAAKWQPDTLMAAKWRNTANSLLQKAVARYRNHLLDQLIFLTETEKMSFLAGREHYFNLTNSICDQLNTPAAVQAAFNQSLFRKSASLVAAQDFRRLIKQQKDTVLLKDFESMIAKRKEIARLEEKPLENKALIAQSEAAAGRIESLLQRRLPAYAEALKAFGTDWLQIKQELRPGEALIEYIRYTPPGSDTTRYGALVLRADWDSPRFMPLCKEETLKRKLNENKDADPQSYINKLYDFDGLSEYRSKPAGAAPKDLTVSLYKVLWEKLEPWLDKNDAIYYIPEGLVHRINPAAIEQDASTKLVQRFRFRCLTTSRRLLDNSSLSSWSPDDYALLTGGVYYQQENPEETGDTTNFSYLSNTKIEATTIASHFSKKNYKTELKTGSDATEEYIKEALTRNNKPRVVHLPTHGAFIGSDGKLIKGLGFRSTGGLKPAGKRSKKETRTSRSNRDADKTRAAMFLSRHPLARSFIILADANYFWETGRNLPEREDGLLTAYEIAQMDLSGVELVVLSACQTGLGDIQDGEGVLGLARALKIAGVRQVLVSLWLVPDEETMSLMTNFYEAWLGDAKLKPTAAEALRDTQLNTIKFGGGKPFNWGSFILIE